ncbi:MAG: flagellar biosynthetic protein FliR [Gammaproteobacteria bacterium]|nr:flagellar biosynthetic protein FliR [Gammaproteobacteria bacterium]
MVLTVGEIGALVGSLLWPLMRISAMLLAMPVMGANAMPVRIRVMYAFFLSFTIAPLIPEVPEVDLLSGTAVLIALHEVILGAAIGLCLQFIFVSLIAAGEQMALSMGLGFATMIDPANGVSVPVLGQLLMIIGALLYFVSGLHGQVIETLLASFFKAPVQTMAFDKDIFFQIASAMSFVAMSAVLISLPITASVLLVYVGLGVMTRAAPQMNIFSVGFPVTLMTGIIGVLLLMPALDLAFERLGVIFMNLANAVIG